MKDMTLRLDCKIERYMAAMDRKADVKIKRSIAMGLFYRAVEIRTIGKVVRAVGTETQGWQA